MCNNFPAGLAPRGSFTFDSTDGVRYLTASVASPARARLARHRTLARETLEGLEAP